VAVALNTYVLHAKTQSYASGARRELSALGGEALARKYPGERIERAVQTMSGNPILTAARRAVHDIFADDQDRSGAGAPLGGVPEARIAAALRRGNSGT